MYHFHTLKEALMSAFPELDFACKWISLIGYGGLSSLLSRQYCIRHQRVRNEGMAIGWM